jgi:hypothetical protein
VTDRRCAASRAVSFKCGVNQGGTLMQIARLLPLAALGLVLCAGPAAFASTSDNGGSQTNHHDTAKGAAAGAVAGHEMGSGHALAGAGVGAAIGHHEEKKAENKDKQ